MKNILCRICLPLMLLILTVGCDVFEDYIVDWAPVQIVLKVEDQDGNDLLDPNNPENIVKGTSITYKGVTYEANSVYHDNLADSSPQTKTYLAHMWGLRLVSGDKPGYGLSGKGYSLLFGEIDGAEDMDEDLVVNWANGKTSTIHYHCSNHKEGRSPSCNRYFILDGGQKVKSSFFTFVFDI